VSDGDCVWGSVAVGLLVLSVIQLVGLEEDMDLHLKLASLEEDINLHLELL
jgi:hypothetical protein